MARRLVRDISKKAVGSSFMETVIAYNKAGRVLGKGKCKLYALTSEGEAAYQKDVPKVADRMVNVNRQKKTDFRNNLAKVKSDAAMLKDKIKNGTLAEKKRIVELYRNLNLPVPAELVDLK